MIKEETLAEALNFIIEQETKLVSLFISSTKSGNADTANLAFTRDVLNDLLETRGNIYDLLAGVEASFEIVGDMTGKELVQRFAEIPMGGA